MLSNAQQSSAKLSNAQQCSAMLSNASMLSNADQCSTYTAMLSNIQHYTGMLLSSPKRAYRTKEKISETKVIGSDDLNRSKFDKYHQVLYLLNLTSSDTTTQKQDYESNRIKPIIDTISDDLNY